MIYSTISRLEQEYVKTAAYLEYKTSFKNESFLINEFQNFTTKTDDPDPNIMQFRVQVAASLAFWCGVVQVKINLSDWIFYLKEKYS